MKSRVMKCMLLGAIIATMSACQRDSGDFLRAVNAKYPLKPDRIAISNVRLDGQTPDPTRPLAVKPNSSIRLTADVADGTWGLSQLTENLDGTAVAPTAASVRPKPKESDRMMCFMAFVRTRGDMATPLLELQKMKIMFFRFKPDGLAGELSATLTAPKTSGKCTIEIYCLDTSGQSQTPEETLNPIFRCLIDVHE